MSLWNTLSESISPFTPLLYTALLVSLCLWGAHQILIKRHQDAGNERLFPRQLAMLGLTFVGVVAIALTLPVSESSRNQVIALIGLVISAIFAFSSSTIFSNIMAGTMLRVTKPFRTGDFIEVGDFFGRVVERGLLDTELQTENRELVALPNTYLITNPISVTRSSGCIVLTTLSLGYDIHHAKVEPLLLEAAKQTGLDEPFVQILELGDYSVTYKVSGMLADVKSLLTARSDLRRHVLDVLHGDGIEIMSPAFMNQRRLSGEAKIIPTHETHSVIEIRSVAETLVFDKAEQAEQLEKAKQQLIEQIETCNKDFETASEENKKNIKAAIKEHQEQLKKLQESQAEPQRDTPNAEHSEAASAIK